MALGGLLCSTILDPRHFPPESSSHFSVTPALMRLSPWRLPPPGDSGLVLVWLCSSLRPVGHSGHRGPGTLNVCGRKGGRGGDGRGGEDGRVTPPSHPNSHMSHLVRQPAEPGAGAEPSTALVLPGALLTSETHGAGRRRSSSESLLYPEKSADLLLLVRHHS